MPMSQLALLPRIKHERLEFELSEVRTRELHLTGFASQSRKEQAKWDRREGKALSSLVDHDLEHGCSHCGERATQFPASTSKVQSRRSHSHSSQFPRPR
jgi:hypothetical protein